MAKKPYLASEVKMDEERSQRLQHLPPEDILKNEENPRLVFRQEEMDSLMVSIARSGVQVPITVFKDGRSYRLIDGERRWTCAKKLNLKSIPALVQEKPSELQNLLLMYNIHALREQWDYFTIASKIRRVSDLFAREYGHTPNEAELSEATGLSRGQIRRCQLLLDLPERFKKMLLKELELPKAQQKLSEDLFIEMERSLKTVVNRFPPYQNRLDRIRDVLVAKFKDDTIPAVTDFRQLSKIATAVKRLGVPETTARKALDRVFKADTSDGIRDAYSRTVEFAYDERKAAQQVAHLNQYLEEIIEEGRADKLDKAFLDELRQLQQHLKKLLKS